jgi:hypothetical protein
LAPIPQRREVGQKAGGTGFGRSLTAISIRTRSGRRLSSMGGPVKSRSVTVLTLRLLSTSG